MKDMAAPEESEALARLQELAGNPNLAQTLDEQELARIGDLVVREYQIDLDSMEDWKKRMKRGLELAALEKTDKTYPWKDAANVKYPLVTTAVLMFNAKAYPAVVSGDRVVKAAVHGADPQGAKAARAERVSAHMSWQLTSKVIEWEEETDKLLTLLPLVGTLFRKTWFDPAWKRVRCRNILPGKLVLNSRVTSLQDAPRCTEEMSKYPAEIQEKRLSGEWLDIEYVENVGDDSSPPQDFLEQHRRMDLDEDGYEEPYIVTVHTITKKVARIVADFTEADVVLDDQGGVASIQRGEYFTAYHFMPSMDGSFFSTGFGLLLGDISESINSIINMMLDAGHMASLGGGFIGSDFRMKGGAQRHRPGEWKMAQATGQAIKDSIVPLTFPGPDSTLFELLGLLIEAGKEVASVKDVLQGETGGKTMTATTTLALIEQGMAQFTAAYKRIFRSLKQEYALIAKINQRTTSPEEYNRFHDEMEPVPMPPQMGQPPAPGAAPLAGPPPAPGAPGADPNGMPQGMPPQMPPQEGAPPPEMMGHNGGPPMQPKVYDPAVEYDLDDMDITPVADPASVTRMQEAAKAQILMEMAAEGLVDRAEASKRMLEAASIGDVEELAPKPDPMQQALMAAEIGEKQAKANEGPLKAQEIQANVQTAMLAAQQAEKQGQIDVAKFQAEMQFKHAEMQNKTQETAAKIDLIHAQIQEIMARIDQGNANVAIAAKKTEADIGLAHRQADVTERKTDAEIARGGEEMEIKRHGAALSEYQAETAAEHKDIELGLKDKETGIKDREARTREKTFKAPAKAKAEAEKPKRKVLRVTKRDPKTQAIEEIEAVDED